MLLKILQGYTFYRIENNLDRIRKHFFRHGFVVASVSGIFVGITGFWYYGNLSIASILTPMEQSYLHTVIFAPFATITHAAANGTRNCHHPIAQHVLTKNSDVGHMMLRRAKNNRRDWRGRRELLFLCVRIYPLLQDIQKYA